MKNDSLIDWADVHRKIPGSAEPDSPISAVQMCLSADEEQSSFDAVDKRLNALIEELRQRFEKLNS